MLNCLGFLSTDSGLDIRGKNKLHAHVKQNVSVLNFNFSAKYANISHLKPEYYSTIII